jgi:hypothetical protein
MPVMLLVAVACDTSLVRWEEPQALSADTTAAEPVAFETPADPAMCRGSVANALDKGIQFSAWLHLRPDSTVGVVAAKWDGEKWSAPATVDSLDTGKFGCRRPAPSIAVSDDGSVHVAYSIKAPEGYGVFFGHSMDRGAMFHYPMIIVYGDRLSATAIATSGPRVAIAYEDPSGSVKRINLALSSTQGHTFEPRESGSPDEMTATHPRVTINDTVVTLSFAGADTTQRALRIGYLRK